MSNIAPYISIGVFIDGGYLAKINEALARDYSMNLDISSLFYFIRHKTATHYSLYENDCQIVESHYFRGRFRAEPASDKHLLFSERKFEDSLIENDVIFHYKHLRQNDNGEKITIIEKGIDVWFALEAYELSLLRRFDFVVLMTGDADHEMLIRKLKALKIRVILLTWNMTQQSSTARLLQEEAYTHIDIGDLVTETPSLMNKLCKPVH